MRQPEAEYTFPNYLNGKKHKNAIEILKEEIEKKEIINNSVISPISDLDLKNIVEKRIPVQLEKDKDWDEKENKKVQEIIIKVKGVLSEDEYHERIKNNLGDKRGNIHYPYISQTSDQKVKKEFIASEQAGYRKRGEEIFPDLCEKLSKNEKVDLPKNASLSKLVEKIGLEKLNSEYGEKYNFLVVKDKKNGYTVWDTSKYAGFGIRNNGKSEKVKNIELLRRKESGDRNWLVENYKWLLRPYETFTFENSEDLESELMKLVGLPLFYTGTTGDRVSSIEIVGLVKKKNSKESLRIIYPEHGNKIIKVKNEIINSLGTKEKSLSKISPSIKLLKISILGKREK